MDMVLKGSRTFSYDRRWPNHTGYLAASFKRVKLPTLEELSRAAELQFYMMYDKRKQTSKGALLIPFMFTLKDIDGETIASGDYIKAVI